MEVVARVTGDFARFVEDATSSLLGTAYLLTRDRQAAEELVQDTLVALYPLWPRVAAAQSPIAYARRALINRYLNQQRHASVVERIGELLPDRQGAPDFARQVDDRDQLRRVLSTLPPRQRAAVVLRYFHDLSDQQVADELGCRATTVRSLISRALSTLRAATGGFDQQGDLR